MSITECITLAIAVLGATLGLLNTWRAFDRDRVRLKITPQWAFFSTGQPSQLCFEVLNSGFAPVSVASVGLVIIKPRKGSFFFIPEFLRGERLPYRLEPRTAITAYMPLGAQNDPAIAGAKCAYVRTVCGREFRGNSPALRGHIEQIRRTTSHENA